MTHNFTRSVDQGSRFNNFISSALTGTVLLLSALLLFGQFAA